MNARQKKNEQYICYLCGEMIDEEDFEYIKTKRGTEIRMHKRCVPRGKGNRNVACD